MKNRPRRRTGISQSGIRRIERVLAPGDRAVRRSFVAAQRPASSSLDQPQGDLVTGG